MHVAHPWLLLTASYPRHLVLVNNQSVCLTTRHRPHLSFFGIMRHKSYARQKRHIGEDETLHSQTTRHPPGHMDQLAVKYMEMCKVESSTDSDSEISRRWSDTSTMGCVSSAPESGTCRKVLPSAHKPAARHGCYSLFLDPYDGSSEDSDGSNVDVSNRRTRQKGRVGGGGCRLSGRNRRFLFHQPSFLREVVKNVIGDPGGDQQPLLDVQMKCGSDSELWVCDLDIPPSHSDRKDCGDLKKKTASDSTMHAENMDIERDFTFDGSGVSASRSCEPQTRGPEIPVEASLSQMLDSSSERSPGPCNLGSLHKRKLSLSEAEVEELVQRKRQCVSMEDHLEGGGSASGPC